MGETEEDIALKSYAYVTHIIKIDLRQVGCGVDYTGSGQVQWLDLMSGVMKLRVSQNAGNALTGETAACQEALQSMHVRTQNFSSDGGRTDPGAMCKLTSGSSFPCVLCK
jgi:hypothetical protein